MKKKFCYEWPRPAVTTDCVIFVFSENSIKTLLIRRKSDPFKGKWAFPGGFLEMEESTGEGVLRELYEETGIKNVKVTQFHTFSAVGRDPRGRTISVAYYALARQSDLELVAGDDASDAKWFPVSDMPPLAFDHDQILSKALDTLREKFRHQLTGFDLLAERFTIPALQKLYECVLGEKSDRRNFRKKALSSGLLEDLNETEKGLPHRGARYYMLSHNLTK